jgi:predicted metal-dependent HD superfamily phosphohydrolase
MALDAAEAMTMLCTTFERWTEVWYGLGGWPGSPELHRQLRAAYAEPHRAYHTLVHVEHCLGGLDSLHGLATRPSEVAIALWFHDAIYDPRASDNEARSAAWAVSAVRLHSVDETGAGRVAEMILATRHDAGLVDGDAAVVVDLDLAILGQAPEIFERYDAQIRAEYAWVPEATFRRSRAEVLSSFLTRDAIYRCPAMRDRFEQQARHNLERAILRLRQPPL